MTSVAARSALASTAPPTGTPVLTEVRDREAQGVDGNERVGHAVLDDEDDVRDEPLACPLDVVAWGDVDLLEIDGGLEGPRAQIFEGDVLDGDLDLLRPAGQKRLDGATLLVGGHSGVGQPPVKEVEGRGVVLASRGTHPTVVLGHELGPAVLEFRPLRLVGKPVVRDSRGAPDLVDPDHEGLETVQGPLRPDVQ